MKKLLAILFLISLSLPSFGQNIMLSNWSKINKSKRLLVRSFHKKNVKKHKPAKIISTKAGDMKNKSESLPVDRDNIKSDLVKGNKIELANAGDKPESITNDSVNISQLVKAQIDLARKKENERQSKSKITVQEKPVQKKVNERRELLASVSSILAINRDLLIKIIVLAGAFILLMFLVLLRRKKIKKTIVKHVPNLKENISLLRQEKLIKVEVPQQKSFRSKLATNAGDLIRDDEQLSNSAKEFKVSKGELMLAARIRKHQNMMLKRRKKTIN